jgi:hypothetical protein
VLDGDELPPPRLKNFLDSVNKVLDQTARRQRKSPQRRILGAARCVGQIEGDVQLLRAKLKDLDRLSSSF